MSGGIRIVPGALRADEEPKAAAWFDQFSESVAGDLSPDARKNIARETADLASRLPHAQSPYWDERRLFCAAAIGSVQSGKTASMIGLSARMLDAGYDIIVVLAGLKNDLRAQTALRFTQQLLARGDAEDPGLPGAHSKYLHPKGRGSHGALKDGTHYWAPHFTRDAHDVGSLEREVRRSLVSGRRVVLVIKKIGVALAAVSSVLSNAIKRTTNERVTMLVIDDEADEASIASADRETAARIVQMWEAEPRLRTTYIGYTATPAANLLQDMSSPLFPRDLVFLLKTPGGASDHLTYREAKGLDRYHCGYSIFYHLLPGEGDESVFVRARVTQREAQGAVAPELEEALISYFVSGAMRLADKGDTPCTLRGSVSELPEPHSMLVHTDMETERHWEVAERVRRICGRGRVDPARIQDISDPLKRLNTAGLRSWLAQEESRWERWHAEFSRTLLRLRSIEPSFHASRTVPSWQTTKDLLLGEVFGNVALKVINSDDDRIADDRLDFTRKVDAAGQPVAPADVYTIVVGGNVLSRGLTILGLCTSYFTRTQDEPRHDTIAQMQRWFGYRGDHLEYCRVFTTPHKRDELVSIGRDDEFLRTEISDRLVAGVRPTDLAWIIASNTPGSPTGKVAGIAGRRLEPSARPFVWFCEIDDSAPFGAKNQSVVQGLLRDSVPLLDWGSPPAIRGAVCSHSISALDAAALLDSLSYSTHDPAPRQHSAFGSFEAVRTMLAAPVPGSLFRAPRGASCSLSSGASGDPYYIAAYLRLWHWAHEHYRTGGRPISMLRDGEGRPWPGSSEPPPPFRVGVRYGSLKPDRDSVFKFSQMKRSVDGDGRIDAGWGTRGTSTDNYFGDEWFDFHPPVAEERSAIPLGQRPRGTPGLILFYVIHRNGFTHKRLEFDLVTCGVSIPSGGPRGCLALESEAREDDNFGDVN